MGRSSECDFYLNEEFVSKRHAKITKLKNGIEIEDLKSKNGIYVENFKITKTMIKLNDSFRIGNIEFFLKEGNTDEFKLSDEAKTLVKKISDSIVSSKENTKSSLNVFEKTLLFMLRLGFKVENIDNILEQVKVPILSVLKNGSLLLVQKHEKDNRIISELNLNEEERFDIEVILKSQELFNKEILTKRISKNDIMYSFPILINSFQASLIYLKRFKGELQKKVIRFLRDFSKEIALVYRLIEENKSGVKLDKMKDLDIQIITRNKKIINLLEKSKKIAKSDIFILIAGETGTGKELFARFIHFHSGREKEKYIGINCSAIPENLLEDELFGHEKGAFTGAFTQRNGKLELASGGTLVLDEIGDMSANLQAKLLRVLQEKEFYRLGGNRPIKVDLRIISLTNKNIKELLEKKVFRADLYYRIAHYFLEIPSLRERKEDIIPLTNYFSDRFSQKSNKHIRGFSRNAIEVFQEYDWPGNIRELENVVKSLISILNADDIVDTHLLRNEISIFNFEKNLTVEQKKRNELIAILDKNLWNKSLAAKELNISRTALYKKMKKLKIKYK